MKVKIKTNNSAAFSKHETLRHRPNVAFMLACRVRRRPSIKATLCHRLVLAGIMPSFWDNHLWCASCSDTMDCAFSLPDGSLSSVEDFSEDAELANDDDDPWCDGLLKFSPGVAIPEKLSVIFRSQFGINHAQLSQPIYYIWHRTSFKAIDSSRANPLPLTPLSMTINLFNKPIKSMMIENKLVLKHQ